MGRRRGMRRSAAVASKLSSQALVARRQQARQREIVPEKTSRTPRSDFDRSSDLGSRHEPASA